MLSTHSMTMIYEAADEYRRSEDGKSGVSYILPILPDLSAYEYSYFCRCLDKYPWWGVTKSRIIGEFPPHIRAMSIDFLCEMLEFPWPSRTDYISPAQVVLGIAQNRGLPSEEDSLRLQQALRDYIERYPEIAVAEFLSIHKISEEMSEALWHKLSSRIQDEIAFAHHRKASISRLGKLLTKSYEQKRRTPLSAPDFAAMQRLLEVIRQQIGNASRFREPGEFFIAAALSEDLDEATPFLRPWIETSCPPFIWRALLDQTGQSNEGTLGFEVDIEHLPKREGREKESLPTRAFQRRDALDELAEKLRHLEEFAPRRHAPLLERLTPAEFAYLCGAMSALPRWVGVERDISDQYALFVQGLNRTYVLEMLETPWSSDGQFDVLRIIYNISSSAGLLTASSRSEFARAFGRFLNAHSAQAAEEFQSLYNVCSLTFASEIWSQLETGVRAEVLSSFRQRLGRRLEYSIDPLDFREIHYLGFQIEQTIESIVQSDEQAPEARSAAASLQASYGDLLETMRLHGRQFLGLLSILTPTVEGENPDVSGEISGALESLPGFIATHTVTDSFALAAQFAEPVRRAAAWVSTAFGRAFSPNPVYVGVSAPVGVTHGSDFIARLYAYVEEFQGQVEDIVNSLAPTSKTVSGLRKCRWRIGEIVTIHAYGTENVVCKQPVVQFEWNGSYEIADFHFVVDRKASGKVAIIGFALEVSGVNVATIQMEVHIRKKVTTAVRSVRTEAARTGFASYATQDRPEVLGRVSSIEQSAGMLIFVDCLDLHPSEEWLPTLEREIITRDVFLLFWSLHASCSNWVTWEWKTALENKGTEQMEIHPLQAPGEAPPPKELIHLNFGDRYLTARRASSSNATTLNVGKKGNRLN